MKIQVYQHICWSRQITWGTKVRTIAILARRKRKEREEAESGDPKVVTLKGLRIYQQEGC